MSFEQYLDDAKTQDAVERRLLVISEAAVRLGDKADGYCPGIPWRDIRGIGNWLRHSYDRVEDETVWNTVKDDLPAVKAALDDHWNRKT